MKTLRCIAVDDEPPALQKIEIYISKISFLVLKGKFLNSIEAIEYIQRNEIDLMFLDIQMDVISGLKVIESLSKKPIIILTTAYASYAVKGFELNVCDYLLKPFDFERFLQASTKALNQYFAYNEISAYGHDKGSATGDQRDFIFVKTAYKYKKVRIDDILYLQGMRDYIMIHTTGGRIMTLSSFTEIEKLLPESKFFRIHKSFVVAISKIEIIDRKRVVIAKEYLPISNTYYDAFILFLRKHSIISVNHKSV